MKTLSVRTGLIEFMLDGRISHSLIHPHWADQTRYARDKELFI